MIKVNNQLASLDLGDNLLGEKGPEPCIAFAKALNYNASLRSLNLSKNRMGPESGRAIAKAMMENRSLTYVNLENNRFDMTVGQAMLEMFKFNITVTRVLLSGEWGGQATQHLKDEEDGWWVTKVLVILCFVDVLACRC